jgi:hypothetical protein
MKIPKAVIRKIYLARESQIGISCGKEKPNPGQIYLHPNFPSADKTADRVAAGIQKPIHLIDETAEVIASSDETVLGRTHEVAARAIRDGSPARGTTAAGITLGLPLVHD